MAGLSVVLLDALSVTLVVVWVASAGGLRQLSMESDLVTDSSVRISGAAGWLRCEFRALHDHTEPPSPGAVHVGAWVGTCAHLLWQARLSGVDADPLSVPDRLQFDSVTRSVAAGEGQAAAIADVAASACFASGISLCGDAEREVSVGGGSSWASFVGHTDIVGVDAGGHRVLIDLKTGRSRSGGWWVQVGGYAAALRAAGEPVARCGILHIPRRDSALAVRRGSYVIDWRDACGLEDSWGSTSRRIRGLLSGAIRPARSPGIWCGSCGLQHDCPVAE